jgi:hypothetical protein
MEVYLSSKLKRRRSDASNADGERRWEGFDSASAKKAKTESSSAKGGWVDCRYLRTG